jgi:hypothetical protein
MTLPEYAELLLNVILKYAIHCSRAQTTLSVKIELKSFRQL